MTLVSLWRKWGLSREVRRIEEGRQRPDKTEPDYDTIRMDIASEIGDIFFLLAKIAIDYGLTLEVCYNTHLEKMKKRYTDAL